jgi:catechol 2,3-dioxygenase-like lactoylglutathione lyase family enzyme
MQLHLGRLIDHVHLRAADLEASRRFYRAVLQALGRDLTTESERHFGADELWVSPRDEGPDDTRYVSRVHLAFQAVDREHVARVHAAMLGAGGRDNGQPGERHYHPGYYAAYALDPDGNNIEIVFHGPSVRSAASVEVRPAGP